MLVYGQMPTGAFPVNAFPAGSLVGSTAVEVQRPIYFGKNDWRFLVRDDRGSMISDDEIFILCTTFLEVIQ